MGAFELDFECGETSLKVRRFSVHEAVSTPFTVSVWARSESPTIDIAAIIGLPAGLKVVSGYANVSGGSRVWRGVCSYMEQTHAERVFAVTTRPDRLRGHCTDQVIVEIELQRVAPCRRRLREANVDDVDGQGRTQDLRKLFTFLETRNDNGRHVSTSLADLRESEHRRCVAEGTRLSSTHGS